MINNDVGRGSVEGLKVARSASSVFHLFFVDNSFVFGKTYIKFTCSLKEAIDQYEVIYGQVVIFFEILFVL